MCLLFGFLHDGHERRVEDARSGAPCRRSMCSIERDPARVSEFERLATTAADAYLAPRLDPT